MEWWFFPVKEKGKPALDSKQNRTWPSALSETEYHDQAFHVEKRPHLDASIKKVLFPPFPDEAFAPQREEANFWLQVHQGLLRTSAALPDWCEHLLAEDADERLALLAPRITALANQLLHHAHSHHRIEDQHFFPIFLRVFPQLERPLDLLEKDHEILAQVLDDVEQACRSMHEAKLAKPEKLRDTMLPAGEKLRLAGRRLDRLFRRHIADEEEICLPSLLRL